MEPIAWLSMRYSTRRLFRTSAMDSHRYIDQETQEPIKGPFNPVKSFRCELVRLRSRVQRTREQTIEVLLLIQPAQPREASYPSLPLHHTKPSEFPHLSTPFRIGITEHRQDFATTPAADLPSTTTQSLSRPSTNMEFVIDKIEE